MRIQIYLTFDGRAEEAFRAYESILGGTLIALTRFKDVPPQDGGDTSSADMADAGEKIMHARLAIGDQILMASDHHPASPLPYQGIHGAAIALGFDEADQGKAIFDALAEGGMITMPFGPTFWADGFGMLVDRFGVAWMINAGEKSPS